MKSFLMGTVALAAIGMALPASAADLAARPYTKAPVPVPAQIYNWTGFYIGGFGGYGWTGDVTSGAGGLDMTGGFGGGTIGYNWQNNNVVFGIEVDAAGADISASAGVPGVLWAKSQINAFGTVRGRLGVTPSPSSLLYVTGGYAWANNKLSVDLGGLTASDSRTHSGWTVGAGLEYMFAPNWSAKVEYLYADLDGQDYFNGTLSSGRTSLNSVKAGINYHFNWGGPVVAKY
ncbi:MAG: outer membrane protein [Xanthobacteraceae bacterium]